MPTPDEPTAPYRGGCPTCGSKRLLRIEEPEEKFVLTQRRVCEECGTVFTPPLPIFLAVPVFILAACGFGVAIWNFAGGAANLIGLDLVWLFLPYALILSFAGVQLLRHRTPKIHKRPRPTEPRPWDKNPTS